MERGGGGGAESNNNKQYCFVECHGINSVVQMWPQCIECIISGRNKLRSEGWRRRRGGCNWAGARCVKRHYHCDKYREKAGSQSHRAGTVSVRNDIWLGKWNIEVGKSERYCLARDILNFTIFFLLFRRM